MIQINIYCTKSGKLFEAWLVDVWGHRAPRQARQVESRSHRNETSCHLQYGQQPVRHTGHTIWVLWGGTLHRADCKETHWRHLVLRTLTARTLGYMIQRICLLCLS